MIENGSSLQLENQWLRDTSADAYGAYLLISAWNLLEKAWFKKCAQKKEIFSTKIFDALCRFVHDDLMVGHPSAQSFQNTPSLEYKVPEQLPTWPILCHQYIEGRWALQNADSIYQVQNYLVLA